MSTRYCPQCGAEYLGTIAQCVDCLVPLLDDVEMERRSEEQRAAATETDTMAGREQTVYELDEWDPDNRVLLARILTSEGIAHVWEATDLVVRVGDEQRVEAIMDDIDVGPGADADADATGGAEGPGEQVVYELSDWDPGQRASLVQALEEGGIPYGWDDNDDLVVDEQDEDAVERLLDAIDFPDALAADDDGGGTEAQDVMSTLFVSADKLMHDPSDHEGVIGAFDGAQAATNLGLPYGFAERDWKGIVDQALVLRDALEADADDEIVIEQARSLRSVLRQYV